MDSISKERRSWNMSRIGGRNTGPEKRVRSLLHRMGYRFSLRRKDLPGRPDIVLPRFAAVIFVHGCFWHRHRHCSNSVLPKTRPEFWNAKLTGNAKRDKRNISALKSLGWTPIVVWECELKNEAEVSRRLQKQLDDLPNA